MRTLSVPVLFSLIVILDSVIALTAVPLQRASFEAARNDAPAPIILGLLLANLGLLALVVFAMFANGRLLAKLVLPSRVRHNSRAGREEVSLLCDTSSNGSNESRLRS